MSDTRRRGSCVYRNRSRHGRRAVCEAVEARVLLSTVTWTSAADGFWDVGSNWSGGRVPTAGDDAVIDVSGATPKITVRTAVAAHSLQAIDPLAVTAAGSLALSTDSALRQFTNDGTITQSAGKLMLFNGTASGPLDAAAGAEVDFESTLLGNLVTLNPGAALNGAGTYVVIGPFDELKENADLTVGAFNFQGGTLDGSGHLSVSGAFNFSGGQVGAGLTVNVQAGATMTVSGGTTSAGSTINNAGTATDSAAAFNDGGTINNSGTFTVNNGVSFGGGGTFNNSGALAAGPGAATTNLIAVTLNNTGTVRVPSGTLVLGFGSSTGPLTAVGGAEINFAGGNNGPNFILNPGAALDGAGLYALTGSFNTLTLNTDISVSRFQLANGFSNGVTGTANFTVTNTLDWLSGNMDGAGATLIPAGAVVNFSGDASKNLSNGRKLVIDGSAAWTGAGPIGGGAGAISRIVNHGAFTATNDAMLSGLVFRNTGTFTKTASSGTTTFVGDLDLRNLGTINVDSGTLVLNVVGGVNAGAINTVAGVEVQVIGNLRADANHSFTFAPGSSYNGPGLLNVTGDFSILTVNTRLAVSNLRLNSDHSPGITGAGGVVVSGTFDWLSGSLTTQAAGADTILPGAALNIAGDSSKFLDGALSNQGTAVWTGAGLLNLMDRAALDNSGRFVVRNDQVLEGGGSGTFINSGAFVKNAGTQATTVRAAFDNRGSVQARSGRIEFDGTVAQLLTDSNVLTGGEWVVAGGVIAFPARTGAGAAIVRSVATIILRGAGAAFPGIASLTTNAGTLKIGSGADLTLDPAASLTSPGKIVLESGGSLTVPGTYAQAASGELEIQIAGTGVGQFGRLTTTAAVLGGAVAFRPVGGYVPAAADSFKFLNYGTVSGTFATIGRGATGRAPNFGLALDANEAVAVVSVAGSDLAAVSVSAPASGFAGQPATFQFSVINNSAAPTAVSRWVDSLYLAAGTTFTPAAVLIGRVKHVGAVAGGASYTGELTAPFPGVLPGTYHVVVVAESKALVLDGSRANNVAASAPVAVDVPALTPGTPIAGTIAAGQSLYFKLDLSGGQTTRVTFAGSTAGQAEVYAAALRIAAPDDSDQFAFDPAVLKQVVLLPGGQAGANFVLLRGAAAAGAGTPFTLKARTLPLALIRLPGVAASSGSNVGEATATLHGSGFTPSTKVSLLLPGGGTRAAKKVYFQDGTTIFATFDLTGLTPGDYDVRASLNGQTATLSAGFTVNAAAAGQLRVTLTTPVFIRRNRIGTAVVDYINAGQTDIPAPLLVLEADKATLKLTEQSDFVGGREQFIGGNPHGPVGLLPPGASGEIRVAFTPTQFVVHRLIHFTLTTIGSPSDPLDVAPLQAALRPPNLDPATFASVFAQFQAQVGGTYGGYQRVLDAVANQLWSRGIILSDAAQLLFTDFLETAAGTAPSAARAAAASPSAGSGAASAGPAVVVTPFGGPAGGGGQSLFDLLNVSQQLNNASAASATAGQQGGAGRDAGGTATSGGTDPRTPNDPNDLIAPAGVAPGHTVPANVPLAYQVEFENKKTADIPAQVVVITDQLDPNLDPATFQVGDFSFGSRVIKVPPGRRSFSTIVDDRSQTGLLVGVSAGVNLTTGVAMWTFISLDPRTGDLTADPLAGFLPPNVHKPQGQAFVNYRVSPGTGVAAGTRVTAQASVVFDGNPAIVTPARFNTIGSAPAAGSAAKASGLSAAPIEPAWAMPGGAGDDTLRGGVGADRLTAVAVVLKK